jgi:hypothetical protein
MGAPSMPEPLTARQLLAFERTVSEFQKTLNNRGFEWPGTQVCRNNITHSAGIAAAWECSRDLDEPGARDDAGAHLLAMIFLLLDGSTMAQLYPETHQQKVSALWLERWCAEKNITLTMLSRPRR